MSVCNIEDERCFGASSVPTSMPSPSRDKEGEKVKQIGPRRALDKT
jgi:hypothetical protein